jgi:endonuclease/exonuclease/phosphatase family metal-dependent hydrolase
MRLPLPIPFLRLFGPSATVLGVLALLYLLVTGRLDLKKLAGIVPSSDSVPVTAGMEGGGRTDNLITIASFNIQVFGKTKAGRADVMAELAKICSYFDVVAIQEVRSPEAQPIENLVRLINAGGQRYDAILSQPIGRTSQTEQYAFVFNTSRIRLTDPSRSYVVQDPEDRIHREPYVANFTAIPTRDATNADRPPFTFTLINVHTDPDEVSGRVAGDNELDVLADTYVNIRAWESRNFGEDDFILLGDLNAERDRLEGLSRIQGLTSVCDPIPTNTRGTKQWDHIMVDTEVTGEFTNLAQVVVYEQAFGITTAQAELISDHRPIWAEFSAWEVPPYGKTLTAAAPGTERK